MPIRSTLFFLLAAVAITLRAASLPANEKASLKAEAERGSIDAFLEMAYAADEATKTPETRQEAAHWYRRAAQAGVGVAALRLGQLYELGDGVGQSYEEAMRYYQSALASGMPEASLRIGVLYLEGWGVPRDTQRAAQEITRAAESGYLPAQRVLSGMFASGIGVEKSLSLALQWAERAAMEDDAQAQVDAGALRGKGFRLREDRLLARRWFELSAEQTYTAAMTALAISYFAEQNTSSRQLAIKWLKLAADAEDSQAAFILAKVHGLNPAATVDEKKEGEHYLRLAIKLGNSHAQEIAGYMKDGMSLMASLQYFEGVPQEVRIIHRAQRRKNNSAEEQGVPMGSLDRYPVPKQIITPVFPNALRLTQTKGRAMIRFIVDPTGKVVVAESMEADHPAFAKAAIDAVKRWQFEPGHKNGKPVNCLMQVPIEFDFDEVGSSAADRRPDMARSIEAQKASKPEK